MQHRLQRPVAAAAAAGRGITSRCDSQRSDGGAGAVRPQSPGQTFGSIKAHQPALPSPTRRSERVKPCRKWDSGLSLPNLPLRSFRCTNLFGVFYTQTTPAHLSLSHAHTHTHRVGKISCSIKAIIIRNKETPPRFKDAPRCRISFPLGFAVNFICRLISGIRKALICRARRGRGAALYTVYVPHAKVNK